MPPYACIPSSSTDFQAPSFKYVVCGAAVASFSTTIPGYRPPLKQTNWASFYKKCDAFFDCNEMVLELILLFQIAGSFKFPATRAIKPSSVQLLHDDVVM